MRWDESGQPVKAFDNDPANGKGLQPRRQAAGHALSMSWKVNRSIGIRCWMSATASRDAGSRSAALVRAVNASRLIYRR